MFTARRKMKAQIVYPFAAVKWRANGVSHLQSRRKPGHYGDALRQASIHLDIASPRISSNQPAAGR